jgi:uncharacterized protein (DUF433 family)
MADARYEPRQPLSIREVAVVTGLPHRTVNRLIDEKLLPADAYILSPRNRRAVYAYATPMVLFGATDGAKLGKPLRRSVMNHLAVLARNRDFLSATTPTVVEEGSIRIDLTEAILTAAEGLRRLREAEEMVVEDPEIRGGIPTIRGTRIGVYEAAGVVVQDGIETALEVFPSLDREKLKAARLYAEARPLTGRPRRDRTVPGRKLTSSSRVRLQAS